MKIHFSSFFFFFLILYVVCIKSCGIEASSNNRGKEKVIIDLDASAFVSTGLDIDDDLALLYALSSPKLEVIGVTTTFGNTDVESSYLDVVHLLRFTDFHHSVPVFKGSSYFEAHDKTFQTEASRFILETLQKEDEKTVTIAAVGPLSNVAAAFIQNPEVFLRVKQLVIMGGNVGNLTFFFDPDLNLLTDREASNIVLSAPVPTVVVSQQTCMQIIIDNETVSDIIRSHCSDPLSLKAVCLMQQQLEENTGKQFVDLFFPPSEIHPHRSKRRGFIPWDVVTVAYLTDRDLFFDEHYYDLKIEGWYTSYSKLHQLHTTETTIEDLLISDRKPFRVLVPTRVNEHGFTQRFIERIGEIPLKMGRYNTLSELQKAVMVSSRWYEHPLTQLVLVSGLLRVLGTVAAIWLTWRVLMKVRGNYKSNSLTKSHY